MAMNLRAGIPEGVLGVDPSLTSTGYSYRKDGKVITERVTCGDLRGPWRLSYLAGQLEKRLNAIDCKMVAYETYAYGKAGGRGGMAQGRLFDIGELGGVYKRLIWDRGIDMLMVSPTALKAVIAGDGRAGKDQVQDAILRHFGYSLPQNDEADAFGLMIMGELRCGISDAPPEVRKLLRLDKIHTYEVIKGRLQSTSKGRPRN